MDLLGTSRGTQGPPKPSERQWTNIIVVFVDRTECRYLGWLKGGFRHCFAAMCCGENWIICDPLKSHVEFSLVRIPDDFDLKQFYKEQGHIVLAGRNPAYPKVTGFVPEVLTCVAIVKKIIGVRTIWIQTPWQLFQFLRSMENDWHLVR